MALENRETMQKGLEESLGCFQSKSILYGPSCPTNFSGQTLNFKYNNGVNQKNADSESDDKSRVPIECGGRPVRQENYYVWSALSPYILKDVHSQSYLLDGCFYPANPGHYLHTQWLPQFPVQMVVPSYSPDYVLQDFQYFVVIDFEATCDKEKNPLPQEIIEFPSVLVNSRTGLIEDCFQIYVRPTHNQLLTEFCKELTGIQQSQVDEGVLLSEALLMHDKWLEERGIKHTNFAVVTWTNWDCRVMLESECRFKKIRKPTYFNSWINLKTPFNKLFGYARRNLKEAVQLAGLSWEGRAHCGLDDAKNTARLMSRLMRLGFKFSITSSLDWDCSGHSSPVHHQKPIPTPEKSKTLPFFGFIPFQPLQASNLTKEPRVYCFCRTISMKWMYQKPGPKHGCFFFGCGNWTANRGPACSFFRWVSAADSAKPS
ncbi:unnamed protein product [Amaranthus hypochondriacus]